MAPAPSDRRCGDDLSRHALCDPAPTFENLHVGQLVFEFLVMSYFDALSDLHALFEQLAEFRSSNMLGFISLGFDWMERAEC